jgi:hypothetical protein
MELPGVYFLSLYTSPENKKKRLTSRDAPTGHKLFNFFSTAFSIAPVGAHQTLSERTFSQNLNHTQK